MQDFSPPRLKTFGHWPSWLNARGHVDRSACFELRVAEVRRLAGCIPAAVGRRGRTSRARRRWLHGVPDLPNEQRAVNGRGRLSAGWWDITAWQMQWLLDGRTARGLSGDWRTGRAPAMRPARGGKQAMSPEQGGYGPGSYQYECPEPEPLDAGLDPNPNRGACRDKKFGLDDAWAQRLWLEKWEHNSVSGVQYFLLCPGCAAGPALGGAVRPCADQVGGDEAASDAPLSRAMRLSRVDAKGLKGLTGTTSNCNDGSRGAHTQGWVCGQRVYKLFWVLARDAEVRDAILAERWIAGLSSGALTARSAEVSALVDRYGAIMGVRALRCRRCLRLRYGQSPQVLRSKRRRAAW